MDTEPTTETALTDSAKMRHLDLIMGEIRKAKQDLLTERDRLIAERGNLDQQITALERELGMIETMNGSKERSVFAGGRGGRDPLSRRVLDVLQRNNHELTFRQMREQLNLDRRESRNLGPVLNQLAKLGKILNSGRGAPWRLAESR